MKELILEHCQGWGEREAELAEKFRRALVAENEQQNLTRLTEPVDFFWGHLWDVYQLTKGCVLGTCAMDLGSGCGVPGLLHALLTGQRWHLVESERRKAEFLARCAELWGLDQVRVSAERVEKVLPKVSVDSLVVRAVGPMSRIWGWIGGCSTWNTLILFKGPSWEGEWADFQREYPGASARVVEKSDYTSRSREEKRDRCLVRVQRQ